MDAELHSQKHPARTVEVGKRAGKVRRSDASRNRLGVAVGLREPESQRIWRVYDEAIYALGKAIYKRYQKYAIAQVAGALRRGELQPPVGMTCVECGSVASVYDHRNYHLHLDVRPVCDTCNQSLPPASVDVRVVLDHIEGRADFYRAVAMQEIEGMTKNETGLVVGLIFGGLWSAILLGLSWWLG